MPVATPVVAAALPSLPEQVERLIAAGVHDLAGLSAGELRASVLDRAPAGSLLVVHPARVPASALAPLVSWDGRPGFVVSDMQDVDDFTAIDVATPPAGAAYLARGLDRGDGMRNWSPDEALPAIAAAGRSPLTLVEGLHWLLQQPGILERNSCFMTVGSRLRKPNGSLDARTPALWISNGTGRDGTARRNAPKVGWCWAGNRHTWLGFASASARVAIPA
ncbi:MAG TPA: DUF5701 family protein [Jatrophihabitans sp.]|uniref:DUF5701 family protein n=1 Tax=Jatrophihabitans sp. TaxID=1932789 RepID=UPI002EF95201